MDNPYSSGKKLRKLPIIKVYQDTSEEWRWNIKAGNGETIAASSEGYDSKQGAVNNLKLLSEQISDFCTKEFYT